MPEKEMSIAQDGQTGTQLLPSGIKGFDDILGGGFPAHHLYLIQGLAGSGKTTLACQIGFHHAAQGRKVLILTLIAESHAKLVQHLSNFSFFDASLLNREIIFLSGYASIAQGGLSELFSFVVSALNEHQPEILIIDGFRSVRESRSSDLSLSEFMHSLNTLVSAMSCTSFLLSPIQGNLPESENTLVDGLIELSQFQDGVRTLRELKVYKARGCKHLLGKHAFEVRDEGIAIYPRLEAMSTRTNIPSSSTNEFASFGIPDWDKLTGGGVIRGSTTNIVGSPGAGKTLMGLHFIRQGLREGEKCLILGFYESPPRLIQKAKKVGIDLATALEDGSLEMIWHLPLEVVIDELAQRVIDNIETRGVQRLFIDGVDGFHHISLHPERINAFLIALVNELRRRDVTTFLTQELPYFKESFAWAESIQSILYENIMLLNYNEIDGVNYRQISVMKLRENDYDHAVQLMKITDNGILIDGPLSSLQAGKRSKESAR